MKKIQTIILCGFIILTLPLTLPFALALLWSIVSANDEHANMTDMLPLMREQDASLQHFVIQVWRGEATQEHCWNALSTAQNLSANIAVVALGLFSLVCFAYAIYASCRGTVSSKTVTPQWEIPEWWQYNGSYRNNPRWYPVYRGPHLPEPWDTSESP
jgi:hypothetical protein